MFTKFPTLQVVLLEFGFTWLPSHLWRLTKFWRGLRMEVPWVDRPPLTSCAATSASPPRPVMRRPPPRRSSACSTTWDRDETLLFSTDYPHWQFDGDAVLPDGLSRDLIRKIMIDNPRDTYSRLTEPVMNLQASR